MNGVIKYDMQRMVCEAASLVIPFPFLAFSGLNELTTRVLCHGILMSRNVVLISQVYE